MSLPITGDSSFFIRQLRSNEWASAAAKSKSEGLCSDQHRGPSQRRRRVPAPVVVDSRDKCRQRQLSLRDLLEDRLEEEVLRVRREGTRHGAFDNPSDLTPLAAIQDFHCVTKPVVLANGYRLRFLESPLLTRTPIHFGNFKSPKKELRQELVRDMLLKKAIEEVTNIDLPAFYSLLFIPGSSGCLYARPDPSCTSQVLTFYHFHHFSHILRVGGVQIFQCLDNWLIMASASQLCLRHTQVSLELCRQLGLIVSRRWSSLLPSQRFLFLGYVFDLTTFMCFPPKRKVPQDSPAGISYSGTKRNNSASVAGPLRLADCIGEDSSTREIHYALRNQWDFNPCLKGLFVNLSLQAKTDLLWWMSESNVFLGSRIVPLDPEIHVQTNASEEG